MWVREAQLIHTTSLLKAVERMHAESQYSELPFKPDKIRRLIYSLMGDTGATVLVGVDNTEAVHGFIALERQQYFFNDDFYVADLGFYVDPSYRMTTLPIRLLAAAEAWAKLQGNALVLGITAPTDAAKLTKTYSKLGYSTWGTVMRKEF